jgi:opacity protein-like surface antigen
MAKVLRIGLSVGSLFFPSLSTLAQPSSVLGPDEKLGFSLRLQFDRSAGVGLMGFPGFTPATVAQQDTEQVQEVDMSSENEASDALPENFFGVKAGIFRGAKDLGDDIFYSEVVLGRYLIGRFFAIEGNVGYLTKGDNWGIPFFLNARGGVPIGFLEPYGGVGIGGLYIEGDNQGLSISEVVFAGDLFLGLNLNLGKRFYVGAEAKYIITQKTDAGLNLGGLAVMGSLGFRF